jgi:hypothetical protein
MYFVATSSPSSASKNVTLSSATSSSGSSSGLGHLLVQDMISTVDSTTLQGTGTSCVVFQLQSKRLHSMPAISFSFSKFQCIVIIAVEMINWNAMLCKTVLDSSKNYQLLGICYEMHSRQYIQLHT